MVMRTPPQRGILKPEWPGSAPLVQGSRTPTLRAGDHELCLPGSRAPSGPRATGEGSGSVLGMGKGTEREEKAQEGGGPEWQSAQGRSPEGCVVTDTSVT